MSDDLFVPDPAYFTRMRESNKRIAAWAAQSPMHAALDFRIRAAFGLVWGPIITGEGAQAMPPVLAAIATLDETNAASGWSDPCPSF